MDEQQKTPPPHGPGPEYRGSRGQFLPGNPGGPGRKRMPQEIKDLLFSRLPERFDRMEELSKSKDERVALTATAYLIDRVLGKPTERVGLDEDAQPVPYVAPSEEQLHTWSAALLRRRDEETPDEETN